MEIISNSKSVRAVQRFFVRGEHLVGSLVGLAAFPKGQTSRQRFSLVVGHETGLELIMTARTKKATDGVEELVSTVLFVLAKIFVRHKHLKPPL